jgi:hypothetical protein
VRPIQDLPQELRDPVQRPLDKYRFGCERLGITAARGDPRISMPSAKAVVEALEELDRAQARQSNVLSDTLRSRFQTADPSERIDNGDEEAMAARYPGSPDGYYWYRTKGQAMAWKIEGDVELESLIDAGSEFYDGYLLPGYVGLGRYFVFDGD